MLFILNSCYKQMKTRNVLFYVGCSIVSRHNISQKQQNKTRIKIEIEKIKRKKNNTEKEYYLLVKTKVMNKNY